MSDFLLHNTLTNTKQAFTPLAAVSNGFPAPVGLYVCGITPYDETHLGHARCYVVFDVLKRVLIHRGHNVLHIQNFTDVDDKIIERAKKAGRSPGDYAEPFIDSFHRYMKALNVLPANHYPRVTGHMPEIIALIERLMANGLAYVIEGSVYYAVRKFAPYGKLSNRNIEDLEAGARVEVDERKRDPLDFALWKKAKEGEPAWDSPWGKGRPGWHIECSAMSQKYLGEEFDIHGGGQDLIFPHHENEVAQSVGASGKSFARFWIHNGFVTVNQQKMSKSLGNFFTLKDILAKFDPMVVRYFLLTQHYRSPLNFSDQELKAAQTAWTERIIGAYRIAKEWHEKLSEPSDLQFGRQGDIPLPDAFEEALADDLNTAAALGVMNLMCSSIFSFDALCRDAKQEAAADSTQKSRWTAWRIQLDKMMDVLGLSAPVDEAWDSSIQRLVEEREQARRDRNWAKSDEIRTQLKAMGVLIEDTSSGPRLKKTTLSS